MTREGKQRPVEPLYLRGVLAVEAELSAGRLYDGSTHAGSASRVLVALVFADGAAMLIAEGENGQIARLRIPGSAFLRLTDDAAGKLARSRQQSEELARRQGRKSETDSLGRPAERDRHQGNEPRRHG